MISHLLKKDQRLCLRQQNQPNGYFDRVHLNTAANHQQSDENLNQQNAYQTRLQGENRAYSQQQTSNHNQKQSYHEKSVKTYDGQPLEENQRHYQQKYNGAKHRT